MELSSSVLEDLRTGEIDVKGLRRATIQNHGQEITYIGTRQCGLFVSIHFVTLIENTNTFAMIYWNM